MNSVSLYDAIKSTYNDKNAIRKLQNSGYVKDGMLSNNNNQVWINKEDKKILFGIKGTNPLSFDDIKTDAIMVFKGNKGLKSTDRYIDSKRILNDAKKKYQGYNTSVVGHSLGSTIGEKVADKNTDKFYGLDGYYQPFKPTSSHNNNFKHYRSENDIVSAFGANKKNVKTLTNPNEPTAVLPLDYLKAHNVENIKKSNITI